MREVDIVRTFAEDLVFIVLPTDDEQRRPKLLGAHSIVVVAYDEFSFGSNILGVRKSIKSKTRKTIVWFFHA